MNKQDDWIVDLDRKQQIKSRLKKDKKQTIEDNYSNKKTIKED